MVPYTGTTNRTGDPFVLSSIHDSNDFYPLQVKRTPKNRVVWDKKLQNRFLLAIKNLDPSNKLVPSAILKEMKVPGLTRENISSHLQKYRKNQHKNHLKLEGNFIEDDVVLTTKNNTNHNHHPPNNHSPSPTETLDLNICDLKNPIIETTFIVSNTQNYINLQTQNNQHHHHNNNHDSNFNENHHFNNNYQNSVLPNTSTDLS